MKLSICIPTFNRCADLRACLTSVMGAIDIANLHDEVEILISDNASTDGTDQYIDNISKDTDLHLIHAWTNKSNIGGVANVKKLLNAAQGEYIFMLTDDDYLTPNALLILNRYLNGDHDFLKTALISNLILSKRCFYYGVKTDISDTQNASNFFEIVSFSHVLSGCIIRNCKSIKNILYSSKNVYPSIEMCALSAGKCIAIAEPLVIHQWENAIFWETDVDMSSEEIKQQQLNREAQLALAHLGPKFLDNKNKHTLCKILLLKYGYIESRLIEILGNAYYIEVKKFKRKILLKKLFGRLIEKISHPC